MVSKCLLSKPLKQELSLLKVIMGKLKLFIAVIIAHCCSGHYLEVVEWLLF